MGQDIAVWSAFKITDGGAIWQRTVIIHLVKMRLFRREWAYQLRLQSNC
jgi:hypothetical protein